MHVFSAFPPPGRFHKVVSSRFRVQDGAELPERKFWWWRVARGRGLQSGLRTGQGGRAAQALGRQAG
eukprot:3861051-Alexandrium_andersonii.AAC.1